MASIEQAQKIICNDTGLMHIAAAFQKEIHLLWGNTIPAFGMGPYASNNAYHYEVPDLNCRPCSKIGLKLLLFSRVPLLRAPI